VVEKMPQALKGAIAGMDDGAIIVVPAARGCLFSSLLSVLRRLFQGMPKFAKVVMTLASFSATRYNSQLADK